MDIWDKKKRSAVMARIKGKDTKPELIVLKAKRTTITILKNTVNKLQQKNRWNS